MKHIQKVLKKSNFIPELGYIVITKDGAVVYNGQVGVSYSRALIGERLCSLADKYGTYAIPETTKFLQTLNVLEKVSSVNLIEKESCLSITFNGKGKVKCPVVLNISDDIPHLQIKWKNYKEVKDQKLGTPLTSLWSDIKNLITSEGEALYGDVLGIYGSEGKLLSFDYGVFLLAEQKGLPDFYCPRALIDLGLNSVDYLVTDEDSVFLVGDKVQFVCCGVQKSDKVNDMIQLKDSFEQGEKKKVTLDFGTSLWKRAKLFSNAVLTLRVKDGEMFLEHDTWSETIGKTEAPDTQFTTRLSLLERWVSGTLKHSISLAEDGTWSLYGITRGGLHFFATLTGVEEVIEEDEKKEEIAESEELDIKEGESLLG